MRTANEIRESADRMQRKLIWTAGAVLAVALAAAVTGIVYGLQGLSKVEQAITECRAMCSTKGLGVSTFDPCLCDANDHVVKP